jgi:hypothetical protein
VTNDTDTFVQEVDESLRQDRVMAFLRQYGVWLLAAAVLLVAGVGGWQVWKNTRLEAARAHSAEYIAAQTLVREGDLEGAASAFSELREKGPRTYRIMARMEYAAVLQAQGDLDGALAEFDAAAEAANDPILRETAQLRAAYIAAETQDFTALQARLQPLIEDGGRLSYLAQELLAIEAWEAGETDLARQTLENLTLAFDAPQAVQRRAQVALSVVGPAPASAEGAADAPAPSEGDNE